MRILFIALLILLNSISPALARDKIIYVEVEKPVFPDIEIAVTIKPLWGLVSSVTKNITVPDLILDSQNHSLHSYHLKPSDTKKISRADVIFMIGSDFETFMAKPITNLAKQTTIISEINKNRLLKLRPVEEHFLLHAEHDHDHHHHDSIYDNHIWLDIDNAKVIVDIIAELLSKRDVKNSATYQKNATETKNKLDELDRELYRDLSTVFAVPYLVYHDAYQYLTKKYGLSQIGAIAVNPHSPPGAATLNKIREMAIQTGAKCIFSEPQFPDHLAQHIAQTLNIRTGTLDPEWEDTSTDPTESYFTLMRNLKTNLLKCLKIQNQS